MRPIRISQYQFNIREPFQTGHPLREEEAQALNALRAENIRNILAHKVRAAIEAADGALLSTAALAELREEAARLDRDYRFGHRRSAPRVGALEREVESIARGLILAATRQNGEELSEEDFQKALRKMMLVTAVQLEARRRIEEQHRIANQALEELL